MNKWFESISLSILISLTRVVDPMEQDEKYLSLLRLIRQKLFAIGKNPVEMMDELPPFVLRQLLSTPEKMLDEKVREQLPAIREVLGYRMAAVREKGHIATSEFAAAQTWSYQILYGTNHVKPLLNLGRSLFRNLEFDKRKQQADWVRAVMSAIDTLREPWSKGRDRLAAVAELERSFQWLREWPQIGSLLLQHQFAWPLLIIDGMEGPTPITVPILVDVNPHDPTGVHIEKELVPAIHVHAWKPHLVNAVRVGKELWRSKHGHHSSFKEEVLNSGFSFDFTYAQRILSEVSSELDFSLSLDGGSAETYFSQVVLNRLLGKTNFMSLATTGRIGEKLPEADTLNYAIHRPNGIPEKMAFAMESGLFERIVLPDDELTRNQAEQVLSELSLPSIDVTFAADLYNLSDLAQVKGWRQYQYIRCPDVQWAVHNRRNQKLPETEEQTEVDRVLRLFADSDNSILTLPEDIKPVTVGKALWCLNNPVRKSMHPQMPPTLSWAFIRLLEGDAEQDARFWQLIWNVTGAPQIEMQQLLKTTSNDTLIDLLTSIFNRNKPDTDRPSHRAPDVIVIIGSKHIDANRGKIVNPLSRPLMVKNLLERINQSGALRQTADPKMDGYLGKIRLVLIPEDHLEGTQNSDVELSSLEERRKLKALNVFYCGFTRQAAEIVLGAAEYGADSFLRRMVAKEALRYDGSKYFMPEDVRYEISRVGEKPEDTARNCYNAGRALAPYVFGGWDNRNVTYYDSYDHASYHEALYYFGKALELTQRIQPRPDDLIQECFYAINHIMRFCEAPNWHSLNMTANLNSQVQNREFYENAKDLILQYKEQGIELHPAHLVQLNGLAIRLKTSLSKELKAKNLYTSTKKKMLNDVAALDKEIRANFKLALEQSGKFPSEKAHNELLTLTNHAEYLQLEPYVSRDQYAGLNERAKRLIREMLERGDLPSTARASWVEKVGDAEKNHSAALEVYGWSIQLGVIWLQVWIKYLGAAALAGREDEVLRVSALIHSNSDLRNQYKKNLKSFSSEPHAIERWKRGLPLFVRALG